RLHDTEKILLQFALTTIIARLQKGIPDQREEIVLQANMQPGSCPYDAKKLIDMNYTTYEVSVPSFGNYFSDLHPDSTTTSFNKVPHMRTVFISYSHEGENRDHIQWVQDLAQKITLHADVRVILDQNGLGAGDNKYQFMDPILKTAEKVLMIFTPDYKFKAEARKPGLGYEYALIIEELLHTMLSNKKYIPVLKSGSMEQSVPIFMHQFIAVDMRDPALFEIGFRDLMAAILDKPPSKGQRSAGFFRGTDSMPGNLPDRTPPGNKPVIPDQGVLSELGKFIPIINIGKDLLSAISEFEKAQELPGTAEPTTHEHDHSNDPLNISHVEHFLPDPVNPHDDWDVGHSEHDDTADDNHSDSLNYDPQDDC
ncbi:MAG: toll/interleukin-1 receptor domain-containing protein, partial [Bacteroidota bacterium]